MAIMDVMREPSYPFAQALREKKNSVSDILRSSEHLLIQPYQQKAMKIETAICC